MTNDQRTSTDSRRASGLLLLWPLVLGHRDFPKPLASRTRSRHDRAIPRLADPTLPGRPASRMRMQEVLTLILGGGRGARLYPLTKHRSEPAVPLAGKYRLIDIPISNCLNSGLQRVYVLTQFLSVSLHKHLAATFKFAPFTQAFV